MHRKRRRNRRRYGAGIATRKRRRYRAGIATWNGAGKNIKCKKVNGKTGNE